MVADLVAVVTAVTALGGFALGIVALVRARAAEVDRRQAAADRKDAKEREEDRRSTTEKRSVAIAELEAAVEGLGKVNDRQGREIAEMRLAHAAEIAAMRVAHVADITELRAEVQEVKRAKQIELDDCEVRVKNLTVRVAQLEKV